MSARQARARIVLLCLLAIGLWSASANATQPDLRTTLRVGVWTLWHDREVKLIPAGLSHPIRLRTCAGCAAVSVMHPASIRAEGDALIFTGSRKSIRAMRISI